ncbi:AKAP7 2'5' RNA ligase-like domain-containing protein [Cunninghamella echinulata]|nr:AKAP7 2'5' RNA ligase-like domain-containing protein [Cunninghamella echinulata]
MSSSTEKIVPSLKGFTLVKVQDRIYRVPSDSINASNTKVDRPPKILDTASVDTSTTIYTDEIITYYHPVQNIYHGLLIGKKGSTLKKLKLATGARIDVNSGKNSLMIKGVQPAIDHAIQLIDELLQQAIEKANVTHFLSFPIQSSYATRKYTDFQHAILQSTFKSDGFMNDFVIPPIKLHITLGVFKLLAQEDIEKAVQFLKNDIHVIVKELLDSEKILPVRLKGLAIMEDDKSKARVLYIQVHDESKNQVLVKLCDAIREKMINAGFMIDENRPLKLHVTLIKTKRVKDKEERPVFDAQPILKTHGELDLGIIHLDKIHLMKMASASDGSYISEGSISIE